MALILNQCHIKHWKRYKDLYLTVILLLLVIAGVFAVVVGIANSDTFEPRDWPSQRNQFKAKL